MNQRFVALIAAILMTALLPVHATSLTEDLGNKKAWETFDWNEIESSPMMKRPEWKKAEFRTNADGEKPATSHYISTSNNFLGKQYELSWERRIDGSPKLNQLWLLRQGVGAGSCGELMRWAKLSFGEATSDVDASTVVDAGSNGSVASLVSIARLMQWDIGKTRIALSCFNESAFPGEIEKALDLSIGMLNISSVAWIEKVNQPVALSCTMQLKWDINVGVGSPSKVLTMLVYDKLNIVNTLSRRSLGENVQITPYAIAFTEWLPSGNISTRYTIDRMTGSVNGRGGGSGKTPMSWTITGQCEKIDPSKQKF